MRVIETEMAEASKEDKEGKGNRMEELHGSDVTVRDGG